MGVANESCDSCSDDIGSAWASIEFTDDVMVRPTHYTLSHYAYTGSYLRSWTFEGRRDGEQHWTLIKMHTNDQAFQYQGQSHTWSTPNNKQYFNQFRIHMIGLNSFGDWRLMAHALEIYGFVVHTQSVTIK